MLPRKRNFFKAHQEWMYNVYVLGYGSRCLVGFVPRDRHNLLAVQSYRPRQTKCKCISFFLTPPVASSKLAKIKWFFDSKTCSTSASDKRYTQFLSQSVRTLIKQDHNPKSLPLLSSSSPALKTLTTAHAKPLEHLDAVGFWHVQWRHPQVMPMSKTSDKEHPPLPSEAAMTVSKRSCRTCSETAPSKCSWLSPDRIRLRAPGVFARCSTKPCTGCSSAQIRVNGGQLARPRWPFSPRFTCRAKEERWALRHRAHRAPWAAHTMGYPTMPPGQPSWRQTPAYRSLKPWVKISVWNSSDSFFRSVLMADIGVHKSSTICIITSFCYILRGPPPNRNIPFVSSLVQRSDLPFLQYRWKQHWMHGYKMPTHSKTMNYYE